MCSERLADGSYVSTVRDDVYGCMCFYPITDIENADLAYAWTRFDSGEDRVKLGGGVTVGPFCCVGDGTELGRDCVVTNSVVGEDCRILSKLTSMPSPSIFMIRIQLSHSRSIRPGASRPRKYRDTSTSPRAPA